MAKTPGHIEQGIQRREQILRFIARRIGEGAGAPTVREVGADVGLKSTRSAHEHLRKLADDGYVERSSPSGSRRIRLTEKGWEAVGTVPMMGRIAAGRGLEAVPVDGESYSLLAELLHSRTGNRRFALRVVGQSMTGAGIEDGDTLIVEDKEDLVEGAVVVALINDGDEVTVKRMYRDGNEVRLVPENGEHKEIVIPADEVRIQGEVVFVMHPPRR